MSPEPPKPVRVSDPGTTPLIGRTARQERDRPIFHRSAGSMEDKTQWEVEVTPLVATTAAGPDLNPAARTDPTPAPTRPRATFEVRVAYFGTGLPEWGSIPHTRKVDTTWTPDVELARAIANAAVEAMGGDRDVFDLVALAKDVEQRRTR